MPETTEGRQEAAAEITVRPRLIRTLLVVCVLIEIALLLLDYHVNYGRLIDVAPIRNLFNATREDGLASWFGVTQTIFVALTLWLIVMIARAQRRSRFVWCGWLLIALFFSYMAVDDGAQVHERLGSTVSVLGERAAAHAPESPEGGGLLDAFPSYAWQVIFVPAFGAVGLFVLVFLWRELGDTKSRVLVAAALGCFVLAVGLDFVEGLDEDHDWNLYTSIADRFDLDDFTVERFDREAYTALRHFSKAIEETLEMFGMTLFWAVFLGHLARTAPSLTFRVGDADGE